MANAIDYLDWRGDIPFWASPMNEVDNYLLCKVCVHNFTGIVSEDERAITLENATARYFDKYGPEGDYLGKLASPRMAEMLRKMAQSERFRNVLLSGWIDKLSPEQTEQFCALTLSLPDGSHYVSFRGTDDTILGWKEDCLLSVETPVSAQLDAAKYLDWVASVFPGPLMTGGHSKGGNLAIYSAACVPPAVQDRILAVFSNDGPGFLPEFLETEGYLRILPKIQKILPQYSTVGTLLAIEERKTVIKSNSFGLMAHEGFNWEVLGTEFVRCPALSRSSQVFDEAMEQTILSMNREQRIAFINELFDTMTSTGARTLTDMTEMKLRNLIEIQKNAGKDREVQKFVTKMLDQMLKEYVETAKQQAESVSDMLRTRKPMVFRFLRPSTDEE